MENNIVSPAHVDPSAATGTGTIASVSRSPQVEKNPVLSRLLDEVRNDRDTSSTYDRVHNRHNRGR